MRVIGIDPGLRGGVALVENGTLVGVVDVPIEAKSGGRVRSRVAAADLAHLLRSWRDDCTLVVVEEVSARPGQGVATMFSLGDTAGTIRGVCQALRLRVEFASPAAWKRDMRLSAPKDETALSSAKRSALAKDRARALASQRWPGQAHLWSSKSRADLAEAALLAAWGMERFA